MDLTSLIPTFGGLIWTLAAFVVALSIIVAVHEFGHYIVGRWSGIKAEVFSIGFGPVLFSRTDRRGTKWQFAALPFGGYVKFLGDASAASDKAADDYDELPEAEKRHTMHGAPLWARAATVAAGPAFNFVLSILVFGAIGMAQGTPREPVVIDDLKPLPAEMERLRPGDTVLAVGGTEVGTYQEFYAAIDALPPEPTVPYTVERDGRVQQVEAAYPFPPLIDQVQPRSAAMDAGLGRGDVIVAVDGRPIAAFRQLQEIVAESEGRPLQLDVWRPDRDGQGGEVLELALAPRSVDLPTGDGGFETRWLVGMTGGLAYEPATAMPGLFESLGYGVNQTLFIIESSLSGLWHMITGAISTCNLSGPIGIAEASGAVASQGAQSFIWFIAVLSTAVGLLNLFPIPVLDGGHLVFHAYEAVRGRPPSDKALRILMGTGLTLMLALMLFAITNDIFCP
ncbi:MAG: regulator of sigma E protease RseP [Rhodobacteraceae bacterium HLUCCA09]|nr:MAG: regulator of sigma E protease RseP [Rhodobacteraceae bacterium HLUCCA09]